MLETNKIYNMDCLEGLKLLESNSVDFVLTSPPYNRKRNDKYQNYTDIVKNWFDWQCNVIDEMLRVTKKHIFYNIQANYYNREDVYKIIGKYSDKIKDIFIWEKSNPMPASGKSITNSVEYFLILGNESLKSNRTYTKNIITTSVNSKMTKEHKAVMKQEVADFFVETFTKENDIILDPFGGLGTTFVSCKKTNRKYIGFEISKQYIDVAHKRINEF